MIFLKMKYLVNCAVDKNLKYGVVGVGHLGKFHVQQIHNVERATLCGIYDLDLRTASAVAENQNTRAYKSLEELFAVCDAVSVVVPTPYHNKIATLALQNNCHVFIEKPITDNVDDAKNLVALAEKKDKKIQVGHIERFNPAYKNFVQKKHNPLFIECHRLAPFNVRGSDVPVVLDLMIHDLDLVLDLVQKKIVGIHASGASIVSNHIDLANARILFEGGITANLTASRISTKQMRQMRVFEKNCYSLIDFDSLSVNVVKISPDKTFTSSQGSVQQGNALFWELDSFVECIITGSQTPVTGEMGLRVLEIAMKIQKIIEKQQTI